MSKNEIRLRRNQMSSGKIARYRNYGEVMARHERHLKLKRLMRILIYILIIVILLVVGVSYFMVHKLQQSQLPGQTTPKTFQTLR